MLVRRHDGREWSGRGSTNRQNLRRVPGATRSRRESGTMGHLERTGQRQLGPVRKTAPGRYLGSGGTADGRRRSPTSITLWRPTPQETCGWSGKVSGTASLTFLCAGMTETAGPLRSSCPLHLRTTGRRRSRRPPRQESTSPGTPMTRATMTLSCGPSRMPAGASRPESRLL